MMSISYLLRYLYRLRRYGRNATRACAYYSHNPLGLYVIITTYYSRWKRRHKTPTYRGKKISPELYACIKLFEDELKKRGLTRETLTLYEGSPSVPSRMLRSSAPTHTSFRRKGFGREERASGKTR